MKLLVVGFDAMDYAFVKEHNFFEKWRKKSDWGLLKSIHSGDGLPHTGPCWSTIYTGVPPGTHGIISGGWILDHKNWSSLKTETIFPKIMEKHSLGLMTMPTTFPADAYPFRDDSWIISGFPAPKPENTDKKWFLNVNKELMSGFVVDSLNVLENPISSEDALKESKKNDRSKLELAKKLPKVDVMYIGYMILDRCGHFCKYEDFFEAYKFAEKLLDDTFEAFKPDKMIVCSDHGMTIQWRRHNMNGTWMQYPAENGCAEFQQSILNVRGMVEEALK